jgi:hypothetical protein
MIDFHPEFAARLNPPIFCLSRNTCEETGVHAVVRVSSRLVAAPGMGK